VQVAAVAGALPPGSYSVTISARGHHGAPVTLKFTIVK